MAQGIKVVMQVSVITVSLGRWSSGGGFEDDSWATFVLVRRLTGRYGS